MLTPRDIHRAQFKRVWKGYNPEEVDEFLKRVVVEYEKVYKENVALKERIAALEKELSEYSATEAQIGEALEMARQAAADAKAAAEREADSILKDARMRAEQLVHTATLQASEVERRVAVFLEDAGRYRSQLLAALRQLSDHLERFSEPGGPGEKRPALREVAAARDDADETVHLESLKSAMGTEGETSRG